MNKHSLLKIVGSKLTIILQSIVDLESFEILLKQGYKQSRDKRFKVIEFTLKSVTWCEPFQLSLFSLWLKELKNLQKELFVYYPTDPSVIEFLNLTNFTTFLRSENIATDYSSTNVLTYKFNRNKPFLPLTFAKNNHFDDLITSLQNESYFNVIFEEVKHFAITKKAVILDILIKEVADNIKFHADGYISNLILIKRDTSTLKYPPKYTPFEVNFFKNIHNSIYLEIVLSDKGLGIHKTLKKAYTEKHEKNKKIDNADIIEYSTFEYSSSRKKEDRLKDIQNKISAEIDQIVPFTGLFQIKEIIKKYRGLMMIRSGNAMLSISADKEGLEYVVKNSHLPKYRYLQNFGGTQIRLLLPIIKEIEYLINNVVPFNYKEVTKDLNYAYFTFFDYFELSFKDDNFSTIARGYSLFIEDIQKASDSNNYTSIIIDCKTTFLIDSKVLFMLMCQIMMYQRRYSIVYTVLNINPNIIDLIDNSIKAQSNLPKAPIIVFTENYIRKSIGFHNSEKKVFEAILQVKEFQLDEHIQFATRYPHLFYSDLINETFDLRHNRKEILELKKNELVRRIHHFVLDTDNKIFYNNIQVLTPSGKYSSCYYETYTLLNSKKERFLLSEWLIIQLILLKPQAIVSIGQHCSKIVNDCLDIINQKALKEYHYSITSTNSEAETHLIDLNCKNKRTVIFLDVVASGRTLKRILDGINSVQDISIVCIANLTTEKVFDSKVIYSIIHHHVQLYDSLPPSWNYEDLKFIDKETNKILTDTALGYNVENRKELNEALSNLTIRKVASKNNFNNVVYANNFLDLIVIPNKAFFLQVYNRAGYMPIMYDIYTIVNLLKDHLAQDIITDVFRLEGKESIKFESLIHFEYSNNPFKNLIRTLLISYPALSIIPVNHNHLEYNIHNKHENFKNSGVIILEDAFTTGESLYNLINYCETRGAKFIFCYVLIKRSDFNSSNKLLKLKEYGNSKIYFKYVFDAELPVYKGDNNPITKASNDIEKLSALFQDSFGFALFLNKIKNVNSYTHSDDASVFALVEQDSVVVSIRWQLELAKVHLIFRKNLSLLFDAPKINQKTIFLFFRILEHEKEVFLNDKNLRNKLFYSSFRQKIVQSIIKFLSDSKDYFDSLTLFDLFTSFIAFESDLFFSYLESINQDMIVNEIFLYPLLVVLSIYNRENNDNRRLKFLDSLHISLERMELYDISPLCRSIDKYWKSEDAGTYAENSSKKISYIRAILKSCFHDFLKTHNYLNSLDIKGDKIIESWHTINYMCKSANENLSGLLTGHLYYQAIEKELSEISKELLSNSRIGQNIIDKIESETEDNKKKSLYYDLLNIVDNIEKNVFSDGLLDKVEAYFKLEIKQHLIKIIDDLKRDFILNLEVTTEPCNIFCSEFDFTLILKNIYENIIQHSSAKTILITVTKKEDKKSNHVIIKFYNNGSRLGPFIYGIGLENCKRLIEKYSGNISFKPIEDELSKNKFGYAVCVELVFHDLSKDVLNRTKYV